MPLPTDAARAGARANPSDARALQVQVQVQVLRYRPPRIAGVRLACDRRAKRWNPSFLPSGELSVCLQSRDVTPFVHTPAVLLDGPGGRQPGQHGVAARR